MNIRSLVGGTLGAACCAGMVYAAFIPYMSEKKNHEHIKENLSSESIFVEGENHHAYIDNKNVDGVEGIESVLHINTDLGKESFTLKRGEDGKHKIESYSFEKR